MRRLLLLALATLPLIAQAQTVGTCAMGAATADLSVNNVRARLYNTGGLFWKGASPVYNVPRAPDGAAITPNAIFAAGLWLGGTVGGELRMAAADYGTWEFWPGPLTTAGELPSPTNCAAYDRIYRVTRADIDAYRASGALTADLRDWPAALGAPVIDGDGTPGNYNLAGGDRPEILGTETAWWVMNDVGGAKRTTATRPLGLEVRVAAFALAREGALGNTTFYRYTLVYRGAQPLTQAYVGLWLDVELGNGNDDYVGSDSARGLAYAYNADNTDEGTGGYGTAPPAIGLRFVEGPLVAAPGQTWTDPDGTEHPGRRRLSMGGMTYYTNGTGNSGDPRDGVPTDWYNYLRGHWRNDAPMRACGNGDNTASLNCAVTRFMFSGDPITRQGWSELNLFPASNPGLANAPSDRRLIGTMGPFSMQPGETQTLTAAIVYGRGGNNLNSIAALRTASDVVQTAWRSGAHLDPGVVSAGEGGAVLPAVTLGAPRPNPARGGVGTVRVGLPADASARVEVYDVLGRRVAIAHEGLLSSGWSEVTLETALLPAGVYVVRLVSGREARVQTLVVAR